MLTVDELGFLYAHALNWAKTDERAHAYAAWYVETYRDAETLDYLPAHPDAWPRFLDATVPV